MTATDILHRVLNRRPQDPPVLPVPTMAKGDLRSQRMTLVSNRANAIRMADELMSSGLTKGEVKVKLREAFGYGFRNCERIFAAVRKLHELRVGRGIKELQNEAHQLYAAIIASPQASFRDKIAAQKRIDKLFGLEKPLRVEHSGGFTVTGDGNGFVSDPETLELLDRMSDRLAQRATDQTSPN